MATQNKDFIVKNGLQVGGSATIAGNLTVDGSVNFSSSNTAGTFSFGDGDKLTFGDSADLQIYHTGSHSIIADSGTGDLKILGQNVEIGALGGELSFKGIANGSATLYYNNAAKLATTSTGVDVTGTVTADGLTVDANVINHNFATVGGGINFNYNGGQTSITADGSFAQGISVKLDRNDLSSFGYFEVVDGSTEKNLLLVTDDGDISFYEDTGTTPKFFWDASAEALGIGTTSPSEAIDVIGNIETSGRIILTNTGSSADTSLVSVGTLSGSFYANTPTGKAIYHAVAGTAVTFSDANTHWFKTGGSERMRIDSSGNVGIGTTTPAAKLDVAGDALINGATVGFGGGSINSNLAFGFNALANNTTGFRNVAIGTDAMYSNTEGKECIAIGYQALYSQTGTTFNNVAVGREAMFYNTTGFNNVAFGSNALYENTTGSNNVGVGQQAASGNLTGFLNVAIGFQALRFNTAGSWNVAIGDRALTNVQSSNNVAVGERALHLVTTGTLNASFGRRSGYSLTTGSNNTFIGENAGYSITTGSNNTIIGRYSGNQSSLNITTASNNIVLSDGSGEPRQYYLGADNAWVFRTGTTEKMRIDSNGNVGIGTTSPTEKLDVIGNILSTGAIIGDLSYSSSTSITPANSNVVDKNISYESSRLLDFYNNLRIPSLPRTYQAYGANVLLDTVDKDSTANHTFTSSVSVYKSYSIISPTIVADETAGRPTADFRNDYTVVSPDFISTATESQYVRGNTILASKGKFFQTDLTGTNYSESSNNIIIGQTIGAYNLITDAQNNQKHSQVTGLSISSDTRQGTTATLRSIQSIVTAGRFTGLDGSTNTSLTVSDAIHFHADNSYVGSQYGNPVTVGNIYGLKIDVPTVYATGLTRTGSDYGIHISGSGYTNRFGGDTQLFPDITTTASAANVYMDTGASNRLYVSTSSIEYKTDVENIAPEYSDAILNLRPVWYRSTASADPSEWSYYGLIAEEVAAVEPRLVHYGYKQSDYEEVIVTKEVLIDENSPEYDESNPDKTETVEKTERRLKDTAEKSPNGVAYDRLSVMLLDIIKRQKEQIEALEARVAALETPQ